MKKYLLTIFVLSINFVWALPATSPLYENAPRPNFMPETIISLEDVWDFGLGEEVTNKSYKINFGFAPESELSGIDYEAIRPRWSVDRVWYQKEFNLPDDWKGAILTFEGIDYETKVFINTKFVMTHLGAYAPFDINISDYLVKGKNVITLKVVDDRARRDIAAGKQERRPKEGVIFYGNSTGAWKGAHLRKIDPSSYISEFKIQASSDGRVSYKLNAQGNHLELRFDLIERETNKSIYSETKPFVSSLHSEFRIDSPKLWTPDSPELYNIRLTLLSKGRVLEKMQSYTGFADFSQKHGRYFLNNNAFYLRGILNQMVFPKGLYTPENQADNQLDIKQIRLHGFNFQRVHNTTPRWRDIYDMENGVMVNGKRLGVTWALEMPSARDLRNPIALNQFIKEWKEVISAYGHGHPGLLYYVPGNEDWGMLEDPDHWSRATDEERATFQTHLVKATLEAAPIGALVSPSDGWRQITGFKNGKQTEIPASQIILSAHDYQGSGNDLIKTYASIPALPPLGYPMPRNWKELIMPGFDFPGGLVAFMLGEFGGKSFAPPEAGDVFGYGPVYRDIGLWEAAALDQLSSMGSLEVVGGYVYTQLRDAGNKPHRIPKPGEPGGELNGILFADGKAKGNPASWKKINLENGHEKNINVP